MRSLIVACVLAALAATTASAQSIGGRYSVKGTNFDGSPYGGTVTISRSTNTTCHIEWQTGDTASRGFCMATKGALAAAYKLGNAVGLVLYELRPDGSLDGIWTLADKAGSGTEVLTPLK